MLNDRSLPRSDGISVPTLAIVLCLAAAVATSILAQATTAYFTSAAAIGGNAFSLTRIIFSTRPNAGATCTASPSTPSPACDSLLTFGYLVPADRKVGYVKLDNPTGANQAGITTWLSVDATATSAMDTTAVGAGGLGLLVFRCYTPTLAVTDCSVAPAPADSLSVLPLYPPASSAPCGVLAGPAVADPFGTSRATFVLPAGEPLQASQAAISGANALLTGASGTITCTGGNAITSSQVALGGPNTVAGVTGAGSIGGGTAQAFGLSVGATDYLGAIVYLPASAPRAFEGLLSTLRFTFTAEQQLG